RPYGPGALGFGTVLRPIDLRSVRRAWRGGRGGVAAGWPDRGSRALGGGGRSPRSYAVELGAGAGRAGAKHSRTAGRGTVLLSSADAAQRGLAAADAACSLARRSPRLCRGE